VRSPFFNGMTIMTLFSRQIVLAVSTPLLALPTAQAHIVLNQKTAVAGSYYRAALRVGHGCAGSPTTAITVRLPAGVRDTKPAPKAGWTIERKVEKLAQPYVSHGRSVTEGVTEVTWRGGILDDAHFDEFLLQMQLPDSPGFIAFKVLQQCEQGKFDWIDAPASGGDTKGMKTPAAMLELVAPANSDKAVEAHKR
jgi:periplasmic copper chaperone A